MERHHPAQHDFSVTLRSNPFKNRDVDIHQCILRSAYCIYQHQSIKFCDILTKVVSLIGKMSTSFHSFSSHSSQNESGMRKWPKNDVFWPEWDWPHPSHSLSFISFRGHPKPRMTLEWEKTSFSSHFWGITKPNFPSSEKCFNFGTVGIKGQTNDTEWLENDKNESKMRWMTVEWYEWV